MPTKQNLRKATVRGRFHTALPALVLLLASYSVGQQKSGAASVTLTAVLSQSLTVSVAPDAISGLQFVGDASRAASPVNVSAKWVRGQAVVSLKVFASGNPLLGAAGRTAIPLDIPSPEEQPLAMREQNFFSTLPQDGARPPGFHFSTGGLQIPAGSETGTLTIRAQAL